MGMHDSSGPRYEDSVKLVKRSKPEAPFQPGVLVKVIGPNPAADRDTGGFAWVDEMDKFIGRIFKIHQADYSARYRDSHFHLCDPVTNQLVVGYCDVPYLFYRGWLTTNLGDMEGKMGLPAQGDTKSILPVGRVVVATRDVGALRKGQRYKIEKVLPPEPGMDYRYFLEGITGWTTMENIEPANLTLDEMKAEFTQLVAQKDALDNRIIELGVKIRWMGDNKRDQFDELEYEVFKTLTKLQSSSIPEASAELTRFIREFIKK